MKNSKLHNELNGLIAQQIKDDCFDYVLPTRVGSGQRYIKPMDPKLFEYLNLTDDGNKFGFIGYL